MNFTDLLAAFRWWVVLFFIGLSAIPITYSLLNRLPDRGYAFSKLVGLLIVSYIFWILASLGFLNNSVGGIVFAWILLLSASLWVTWRERRIIDGRDGPKTSPGWWEWIKANWRYILAVEVLFIVVFGFWVWVRAQNPSITATEKPMELAFLNSATHSITYPPSDPWLSGYAISYYYFGYVMTSVLIRLSAVPVEVGFNLGIAWLVAGTSLGAFGLVYNLIRAGKGSYQRNAIVIALVAAIAVPVAGNLEIMLEMLHANGIGSNAFWSWMDVRDLNGPAVELEVPRYETTNWWWWRSSRVIHEYHLSGRAEEGLEPIAEFPGFSFVLGDMHAHVLALPFALLSLAVAFAWWLRDGMPLFNLRHWRQVLRNLSSSDNSSRFDLGFVLFTALLLGGLSFLNTWDVLIHLFVIVSAYTLALRRREGQWSKSQLGQAITAGVMLTLLGIFLYLPQYLGFRSQASAPFLLPMVMRPTRLVHYLVIFGMPLVVLLALLARLLIDRSLSTAPKQTTSPFRYALALVAGLLLVLFALTLFLGWLVAAAPEGAGRVASLADELNLKLPGLDPGATIVSRFGWAFTAVFTLLPTLINARVSYPALTLFLAALLVVTIYLLHRRIEQSDNPGPRRITDSVNGSMPFVLLLIGTGILLSIGPEFVYIRDNFGQRINTIFKFYYQTWVLFGVSALFGLEYLLRRFRASGWVIAALYALALAFALMFPYYAIQSRAAEYNATATTSEPASLTLDGLAYMRIYNPDEYEAIQWLKTNAAPDNVVLEAVGGQYSAYGRVAASTGLSTVLGWPGHEYQWRGDTPEPGKREPDVRAIYNATDWNEAVRLLDEYEIDLIYFGALEKSTYDPRSETIFDRHLDIAFRNNSVTIYRWNPGISG